MKFSYITTILLVLVSCAALQVPTSRLVEDEEPKEPVEPKPTSRRTTMVTPPTFQSVITDLNAIIANVGVLEDEMVDLQTDFDTCEVNLADCLGQSACSGLDNLVDLKAAISGAANADAAAPTIIPLCQSTISLVNETEPILIHDKHVVITCEDPQGSCTIDGEKATTLFKVTDSDVTFQGIDFKNSFGEAGALFVNGSSLTTIGCTFSGNEATDDGGAIDAVQSTVHVNATAFLGNTAIYGGGAVLVDESTLGITDGSSFSENEAQWGGAIIAWDDSTVSIKDSSLSKNRATGGGAMYAKNTELDVSDGTTIFENEATGQYGGGALLFNRVKATLSDTMFIGNKLTGSFTKGVDISIYDDYDPDGIGTKALCDTINEVTFCEGLDDAWISIYDSGQYENTNCDTAGAFPETPCPSPASP